MGNRVTGNDPKQTESRSYGDIFDELFPHYLLMGMTPEQYWDGESWLKKAYRKAYILKIENEQKISDCNNWHMGQYIIAALRAVPLLVAGFNVKSSTNIPEYPDRPLLEKYEIQRKEEAKQKYEEDQSKLAMAMFQAMITKFNKNMKAKEHSQETIGQ